MACPVVGTSKDDGIANKHRNGHDEEAEGTLVRVVRQPGRLCRGALPPTDSRPVS